MEKMNFMGEAQDFNDYLTMFGQEWIIILGEYNIVLHSSSRTKLV